VCGAALPPGGAWPTSASRRTPTARKPFFLIAGIVTAVVLLVAVAGIAASLIYIKSGRSAAPGLAGLTPEKIGTFKRISTHTREALPPRATDALDASYSDAKGNQMVGIRLVEFPDAEQTSVYAQSRVAFFEEHGATIQQRTQVKNEDGSIVQKIIMKENAGTDIESEVIISNNKSIVLIVNGMPYGTATELASKIRF
jgi:hypothetical protein